MLKESRNGIKTAGCTLASRDLRSILTHKQIFVGVQIHARVSGRSSHLVHGVLDARCSGNSCRPPSLSSKATSPALPVRSCQKALRPVTSANQCQTGFSLQSPGKSDFPNAALPPPRPHSTKDAEMQVGSVCCDSNPEPQTTRSQAICPSLSDLLVDMVLKLLARQSFLLDHGRGHLDTSPALFRHFRGGGSHLV